MGRLVKIHRTYLSYRTYALHAALAPGAATGGPPSAASAKAGFLPNEPNFSVSLPESGSKLPHSRAVPLMHTH